MINIDMEMKVAGRVAFQKYKIDPTTGERVNTSEEMEVDNIITQAGLNSINASSDSPQLAAHYLALGEGTQLEELSVTKMANIKTILNNNGGPSTETKLPPEADKDTVPQLMTKTIKRQFSPSGEERTYTEVAIVSNSNTSTYTCYTYAVLKEWNDVSSSYDPVSITVAADEYLEITYKYQVSYMPYFPVGLPVTGEGFPSGTLASLYKKRSNTAYASAAYYLSQDDVATSGWGANFDKFHPPTQNTFLSASIGYYGIFGSSSETNPTVLGSEGELALTTKPSEIIQKTDMPPILPPGALTNEDIYLVCFVPSRLNWMITFNKGIFLTKDHVFNLSVNINHTSTNTTWTDPDTYD